MTTKGAVPPDYVPDELGELIMREFPRPIAVNYRRLLDMEDWQKKTEHCLRVFEFGLRAMALGVISQYLIRDADKVNDPYLNKLLLDKLPGRASLGTWQQMFFTVLQAYQGKRALFFMPELYDFYWDTRHEPHRRKKGIENSFTRLVQIRNDLAHRLGPSTPEGWESLFQETFFHLREVLKCFTFLQKYDLIRIVGRQGDQYEYMVCTGLEIVITTGPLQTKEELESGWFYLSKDNKSFLQLHPLLIFWEETEPSVPAEIEVVRTQDAAIYDSFTKDAVNYLATVLWQIVSDKRAVADFVRVLYYTIQEVKMRRRKARKLSWLLLKDIAREIAESQAATAAGKYVSELYVQRASLLGVFRDFLDSKQNCFVLLGRSGVGKSSFFLSLVEEYEDWDDACVFFFDGARLDVDRPLVETLTREFQRRLRFLEEGVETEIEDVVFEISRIEGMQDKKVLLLIDAINENRRSSDLLMRIDSMISDNPFPWLKVAVSSRPEAWQVMNRSIRGLATDRYYVAEDRGTLGIELGPFAFAELIEAYGKYKRQFKVRTNFDDLGGKAKQVLRDPLALRLVMETNAGQRISTQVGPAQIIKDYLEMLVKTKRLLPEDIVFLEQEIMPLMINTGYYSNTIGAQQINVTTTSDGRWLRELIMSDDVLSNGRRVNSSFINLADAEILALRGEAIDYEVVFKYERFYDHFAGRRIHEFSTGKDQVAREEFYRGLMQEVSEKVFLWGAVKQALTLELQEDAEQGQALLDCLSRTKEQVTRDLVIATLVDLGEEEPVLMEAILRGLAQVGLESRWSRISASLTNVADFVRLARGVKPREPEPAELARAIVPAVVGRLDTPELLAEAASDHSYFVRKAAVESAYVFWRRIKNEGQLDKAYTPIRQMGNRAGRGRRAFPDVNNLTSLLEITTKLAVNHMMIEGEVVAPLLPIWREVLSKIPFVLPGSNTLSGRISDLVRNNVILRLIGGRVEHLVRISLNEKHPINAEILTEWFHLPAADREEWKVCVSYCDPQKFKVMGIRQQLIELSSDERPLFAILIAMILPMHAVEEFDAVINIIDDMARTGNIRSINVVLRTLEVLGEIFAKDMTQLSDIVPRARASTLRLWEHHDDLFWEARDDVISWPMFQECMLGYVGAIPFASDLIKTLSSDLPSEERRRRLQDVIRALGGVGRSSWRFERQALETMSQWFCVEDQAIRDEIVSELSKIHVMFPRLVSDLIARSPCADELLLAVERQASSELVTGAASQLGGGVLYALFSNPQLRRDWIALLVEDIGGSKNFNDATRKAADRLLRVIYEI